MTEPIVLSDEEDQIGLVTPVQTLSKKRRTESDPNFSIIVIDDPTPQKLGSSSAPLVVPDTPISDVSIVKCTGGLLDQEIRVSSSDHKFSGISGMICLESDNDSESGSRRESLKDNGKTGDHFDVEDIPEFRSRFIASTCSLGNANLTKMSENDYQESIYSQDNIHQVHDYVDKENVSMEQMGDVVKQNAKNKRNAENKNRADQAIGKNKKSVEEKNRLIEEKKLRKEQEKLQKAALKAGAAEMKKLQKEKQQWEKGKFALKSIVAEIDSKVVELGSIGGHLLTRFSEKGLTFRITSNPVERSIVWTMNIPEQISQLSSRGSEVPYILLVYEAEEFCNLINNEALMDHVSGVSSRYPSYTICYLTNRLMGYINKREQGQYKNPSTNNGWRRPPVEEVFAKFSTNFHRVHSRQCIDEAELAEHIVGLTSSLATCQFRKKLTRLSVNASELPKDSVDRNLIKKSSWLKALVSIPKVQPRFAIAIWKKYPTMKSLLRVYMDPSKSVHEEFLLKDLTTGGLLGNDRRLGEVCSKRVYRVLMAQCGNIKTDDIENGADFFRVNSQNS